MTALLRITFELLIYISLTSAAFTQAPAKHPYLTKRDPALESSTSVGYAPTHVTCPSNLFVRAPNGQGKGPTQLGQAETTYIKEKTAKSIPLWESYLSNVNLQDFDIENFLKPAKDKGGLPAETLPNIGFALSGGGGRALCLSAAILEAFDSRNPRSNEAKIGGIIQLANYAVGVSGSSWLLGSWATSNFPQVSSLIPTWGLSEENDIWDWNIAKDYLSVYRTVKEKKHAGFPVTIVDVWGRIISRHFINEPEVKHSDRGLQVLWSSIRETSGYKQRDAPFVIAVTTSRPGKRLSFTSESPSYEFSAEEFGVFHPHLNASIPIDFLGSIPPTTFSQADSCVRGFDNAGFVMAMSSNIFSQGDSPKGEKRPKFLSAVKVFIHDDNFEGKVPNAFKGLGTLPNSNSDGFQDNAMETILMADSGLIHENIPMFPLIQPERRLDVVIAVDSSADGKDDDDPTLFSYPNGTSLYTIYEKTKLPSYSSSGYRMPKIPNSLDGTFTQLGYNQRPTFFGCEDYSTPLIIYLPNYYASDQTNMPTSKSTYTPEDINKFIENGFSIASQNAGPTKNSEWAQCFACAMVDRQVRRNSVSRAKQCQSCFEHYCAKA